MAAVTRAAPLARRCAHDAARVGACRLLRRASSSRAGTPPGVPVPAASARFAPTIAAPRRSSGRALAARRLAVVSAAGSPPDAIYRVMSENQEVSVIAVVGTSLVADAVSRHKTAPTATAALGRTMLAATLLGTFKGDDEATQITFKGDGPIGQIIAISDSGQ